MSIPALLLGTIVLTSILSGVIGMAGGMVLMAVMVAVLSVPAAMVLHGVTQLTANGSRCYLLREHIRWGVLPPYILGTSVAALGFALIGFIPPAGVVLLLVGLFPWLGRLTPHLRGLDIERRATATGCGFIVTLAQLTAGASGPLLDVFFLQTTLTRHEVIATKALTQTVGHLVKLLYYGVVIKLLAETAVMAADGTVLSGEVPLWLYPLAIIAAVTGTKIGTMILDRMSETNFKRYSTWIILTIATWCIISGIIALWPAA